MDLWVWRVCRCIVEVKGLGFKASSDGESIRTKSLFMAQVSSRLPTHEISKIRLTPRSPSSPPAIAHMACHVIGPWSPQELCNGGSLRDKVLTQMTSWHKVQSTEK